MKFPHSISHIPKDISRTHSFWTLGPGFAYREASPWGQSRRGRKNYGIEKTDQEAEKGQDPETNEATYAEMVND
jgi:hypothetical protein